MDWGKGRKRRAGRKPRVFEYQPTSRPTAFDITQSVTRRNPANHNPLKYVKTKLEFDSFFHVQVVNIAVIERMDRDKESIEVKTPKAKQVSSNTKKPSIDNYCRISECKIREVRDEGFYRKPSFSFRLDEKGVGELCSLHCARQLPELN